MKRSIVGGLILAISLSGMAISGEGMKFSGQLRHRYEMNDKDFDNSIASINNSFLRTRLNASFSASNDVSIFVQLQDSRKFGTETSTLTDGSADGFDLHQGYAKITNLFELPLDLKLGRYEAAYGPQRLMGAVGWHNIGRSFDGFTFTYHNDLVDVDMFNFKESVEDTTIDMVDKNVRGAYANFKFEGYKTQAFFIQDATRNTAGIYAQGKVFGDISHETEFAYQFGEDASATTIKAFMFGFNLSCKMKNMSLSGGVDYVSGDDIATSENESFHTLYATNHKYYGFMDYFLNIPKHTDDLGLMDIHLKASMPLVAGINGKLAYHIFNGTQDNSAGQNSFGNELDITLIKKYNDNVKFVGGYSMFTPGDLKGPDSSTWAYLMTIVNF